MRERERERKREAASESLRLGQGVGETVTLAESSCRETKKTARATAIMGITETQRGQPSESARLFPGARARGTGPGGHTEAQAASEPKRADPSVAAGRARPGPPLPRQRRRPGETSPVPAKADFRFRPIRSRGISRPQSGHPFRGRVGRSPSLAERAQAPGPAASVGHMLRAATAAPTGPRATAARRVLH